MEGYRTLYPLEFYRKFLIHSIRPDSRTLDNSRKLTITTGSITTTNGSSFVKLGNTFVTAGVRAEMGPPPSNNLNRIIVNVELTPICSNKFRPGKPSEQAQVLCEFLNSIIQSDNFIDWDNLTFEKEEHKLVWYLYVDIYCLNYDGNLYDSALLALISSLIDVNLPKVDIIDNILYSLSDEKHINKIKLKYIPIPLTFGIMDDYILVDPTNEEEELLTSQFTIVYTNNGKLCSVFKPGGISIEQEKLSICIQRAESHIKNVLPVLMKLN